jgi:hypothetical protein
MRFEVDIDELYGGKAPRYIYGLFYTWVAIFLAGWLAFFTIGHWAPTEMDSEHPHEFRVNGRTYFLAPAVGQALDWFLPFCFVAFAAILLFAYFDSKRKRQHEGEAGE